MAFVAVLSVGPPWSGTFFITDLKIIVARKPSSSSNTTIYPNKDTEERTRQEDMANDASAVNGHQNHDKVNTEKPAMTAKEPAVPKSMAYEPLPAPKRDGLSSNGTVDHQGYSMTQRKAIHFEEYIALIADTSMTPQVLRVSLFRKISKSQCSKRQSSQRSESLSPLSMILMTPLRMV